MIEASVAQAEAAFSRCHRESEQQLARASRVMPGGNTRSVLYYEPFPVVMARGGGCRLWDLDGHEYVDFLGEFTASIYGHTHPTIRRAIMAAVDNGVGFGAHHALETKLANAICARFPSVELVRFTNSGTEANLMAIALAKAYTRRSKVLVFDGAYHGGLLNFGSVDAGLNAFHGFLTASYNDVEGTSRLIRKYAGELAAVIVEPMLGAGGCIPGTREFLGAIRDSAQEVGTLVIFDEVMTSRLGAHGLQTQVAVRADLTTLGKYIGGGSSMGAFGGRSEIMRLLDPRRPGALQHAGTFNNNVISMAAGAAGLTEVYTEGAAERLSRRGEVLRGRLNDLCAERGAPLQFSGVGSLMNAHATTRPVLRPYAASKRQRGLKSLLFFHLLEQGFYTAKRGLIALSLPLGEREIEGLVTSVREFLARYDEVWRGFE